MPKKKTKSKKRGGARPNAGPKQKIFVDGIDWKLFEDYCHSHATRDEIACWFRISEGVLTQKVVEKYGQSFTEVYARFSKGGSISFRRRFFQRAMAWGESPAIAIFWAKNHLGMTDKKEVTFIGGNSLQNMSNEELERERLELQKVLDERQKQLTSRPELYARDVTESARPATDADSNGENSSGVS